MFCSLNFKQKRFLVLLADPIVDVTAEGNSLRRQSVASNCQPVLQVSMLLLFDSWLPLMLMIEHPNLQIVFQIYPLFEKPFPNS
ncbi:hypothetical protein BLOT_008378 [Blomia tropicalis]|nr:hypothetical protein BLOT_008378 [Blomia tropicalis]